MPETGQPTTTLHPFRLRGNPKVVVTAYGRVTLSTLLRMKRPKGVTS